MMRRDLLGAAVAARRAGALLLRPPGPRGTPAAPRGYVQPSQPGVAAGPSAGPLRARQVIISGPAGSGLFVYSPSAGFGNLKATIEALDGFDIYGNATLAGFVSYAGGTLAQQMLNGVTSWYTAPGAGGPWTLSPVQISFGSPGQLNFQATDINMAGPLAGIPAVTWYNPNIPGPEVWHSLGTLTGYTVTRAQYRMNIMGEVEFDISVNATGVNALNINFSNTLAAPYLPLVSYTQGITTNLAIASWTASPPRIGITAAGVVSHNFMTNQPSGTNVGFFAIPTT
jgi:hypothetical protein